jgi:hypothetical protein
MCFTVGMVTVLRKRSKMSLIFILGFYDNIIRGRGHFLNWNLV